MKSVIAFLLAVLAVSHAFTMAPAPVARTTTALDMTVLSYNGKKKDFREGSPLKNAVRQLGVKVKYSCNK